MENNIDPAIQFLKREWLTFILNSQEKIVIQVSIDDVVHCCYWARILFVQRNLRTLLTHWEIQENIEQFVRILDAVVQNKLPLNRDLDDEIGYLWNFVCKKKNINDEYSDETFAERATLKPYLIFNDHDCATWMYNDDQGNIIFKITPLFPKGKPRNRIAKYITFLHWMKAYKPMIVRIIPEYVALQWLEQARQINNVIQNNIKEVTSKRE